MWLDNLKRMKVERGMTTKEIAQGAGLPEPTLEKLFAGVTKDPKLGTVMALVHYLGYTLDDLDDTPKDRSISTEAAQLAAAYDQADEKSRALVRIALEEYVQRVGAESDPATPAMSHTPLSEEEIEEDAAAFRGLLKGVQTLQNLPDTGMKPPSNSTSMSGENGQSGKAG